MFRRRCGAVIDEDYVQEHILTGGNVAPLEAPRRRVNRRPAISLGVVASYSIQDRSSDGTIFRQDGMAYASTKKHFVSSLRMSASCLRHGLRKE
jgi:hypothetical protein